MMGDLANQYVYEGIQGGILTFILFLLLILFCFFRISAVIDSQADHTKTRFFTWAIGSTLFVHVIAFWGISYWDQLLVTWYTLLAIVASLDAELFNDSTAAKEVDDLF
jgi:O-antigen ligase